MGESRAMLKLDIAHAFSSMLWALFEVLQRVGFGQRFPEWIAILLSTGRTGVMLNGEPGPLVWHHRGM